MPLVPPWNDVHPVIVHFPIALLPVAALLLLLGLAASSRRTLLGAALLVMSLGTVSAWVAVATGDAASRAAGRFPGLAPVVERHAELAAATRTLFSTLTLAFATLLVAPWAIRRELPRAARLAGYGVLLAAYSASLVCLALTADQGGRLAHQSGPRPVAVQTAEHPGSGSAEGPRGFPAREGGRDATAPKAGSGTGP
jgi:uncharacterized membrane protein